MEPYQKKISKNDQRKLRYHHRQPNQKDLRSSQTNPKRTCRNLWAGGSYGRKQKMSRAVGNALHKNPDPEHIPCFRVVNAKGELAGAFAFGGEGRQRKLLEEDGVQVVDGKVDLNKFGIDL